MNKDYTKYSDRRLIEMLKSDKKTSDQAFIVLHDRYSKKVYTYIKCMCRDGDLTNDLYQETFIRMFKYADPDYDSFNLNAFLITTARNLCFNSFRERKRMISIDEMKSCIPDMIKNENDEADKKELFQLILMAVELLDDAHKEAFVLRKFENLSLKEIADICNISIEGVKKRITRAKLKITKTLKPYIEDLTKNG